MVPFTVETRKTTFLFQGVGKQQNRLYCNKPSAGASQGFSAGSNSAICFMLAVPVVPNW